MGTVYRATHTLMDKPLAVKVLRVELATDGEAVARFHREARSASRLDHDHCIRVTDFGQSDDGLLFLVMELLDGVSLSEVARAPLPPARAAAIGLAIAEALAHAHERGVIHRDLKPDNVMLARRERGREQIKVLDFGLAKLASDSALGPSITRDGTVFGTPEYMAPEQAEGRPLDGRTDVYALGIILYQLLTGEVPFRSSNFMALLTQQISTPPLPLRQRRPDLDLSPALEQVVLRCLEKRPEGRYDSAAALAAALKPFAAADTTSALRLTSEATDAEVVPPSRLPPARARHFARNLALGLGSFTATAAVVGVAFMGRARRPIVLSAAPIAIESSLSRGKRLLAEGNLDAAAHELRAARRVGDSAELQEALAQLAEQLGNRLGALAHLHRAVALQPDTAEPRARLAALLLRLEQPAEACRLARSALERDAGLPSAAARAVLAHANCKESP